MKNNKGFTLVELLAVIVILAVVAIIAIPIILNVIESAKKGAIKDSAHGILEAANVYIAGDLKNGVKNNIEFACEKNKCISEDGKTINFKGKVEHGTLIIDTKGDALVCVDDGEYYALKNVGDQNVTTGDGTCGSYEEENGAFIVEDDLDTLKAKHEEEIRKLEDENNKLTEKLNIVSNYFANHAVAEYSYTGNYETFTVPMDGTYTIELWGAAGTGSAKGAYTKGDIKLKKDQVLYFYVGQAGSSSLSSSYNGGTQNSGGYAGGGATDVRLVANSSWRNFDSLKSRIMVAAGGGSGTTTGSGGELEGIAGAGTKGGTQTSAGKAQSTSYTASGFGHADGGCTGGNGYYGGGGATCANGAGGGSSFISGHTGCDAIDEDSTSANIIHTGQPVHYSKMEFTNTVMIAGNKSMPKYDGSANMTGNSGNGHAKVTIKIIE